MITPVEVKVADPWQFYLQKSKEVVGKFVSRPDVLKADCRNEIEGQIPMKGGIAGNIVANVTCLEINADDVAKAVRMGFKAIQGDIRKIPFPDASFNIVIDCSTLDHVHPMDVNTVLAEYKRVLKVNGICLLFTWVIDAGTWDEKTGYTEDPKKQYTFQHSGLVDRFAAKFILTSEEIFNKKNGGRYMTCLIGSRGRI